MHQTMNVVRSTIYYEFSGYVHIIYTRMHQYTPVR